MIKKTLVSLSLALGLASGIAVMTQQVAQAAPECKADSDCKTGEFCILALTPHQCKPPQAAGASCKRDVVCASKKCDIPAGKPAGVCK